VQSGHFGGHQAFGLRLVALLGVLVVPRLLRFLGDLVLDVLPVEDRLAPRREYGFTS